eukprot:514563-Amphidinium_carterae.1
MSRSGRPMSSRQGFVLVSRHLPQEELGFRLISSVCGAGLAPFEFEDLDCYMAIDGVECAMQRVRQVFGKSSIIELGFALPALMERTSQTSGQTQSEHASANRVREHKGVLPEEALSFIHRSNLSPSHKASLLAGAGQKPYSSWRQMADIAATILHETQLIDTAPRDKDKKTQSVNEAASSSLHPPPDEKYSDEDDNK